MKNKIMIMIAIFTILVVLVVVGLFFINSYRFDFGNGVVMGSTKFELRFKKGAPEQKEKNVCDTNNTAFYYTEEINGYTAKTSYDFNKGKLQRFEISINSIDYDSAKKIVDDLIREQEKKYSNNINYYFDEIENKDSFCITNGIDNNISGVSCNYEYLSSHLVIYAEITYWSEINTSN